MRSPAFVTVAFGWGKADIEADRSKVTEDCRNGSISDTRTGHRTLRGDASSEAENQIIV